VSKLAFAFFHTQVADLDDEFAELLLGVYGENFDAVPPAKVSNIYLR
jgi:hypothetical protein